MIDRRSMVRRVARAAARAGAVGSGVMVAVTAWGLAPWGLSSASAATLAGAVEVVTPTAGATGAALALTSGTSATPFTLRLPLGAACAGDSANAGYRWQTYMVPATVDPGTLTFGSAGPLPANSGNANFRQPLFNTGTGPVVNQQTAEADTPGGPGRILNVPDINYAVFGPGDVPPGEYNIGIACTLGSAGPTQMEDFWNVKKTFTVDTTAGPAQVKWAAAAQTSSTTNPGATSTTTPGATTTTAGGSTTTTGATSTTIRGATTTIGASSTSVAAAANPLARTGGNPFPLVVWSALLLLFGRMAVLVGRRPQVRTGGPK